METLRLGLIGTQFIGNLYVHSLQQVPDAEIVAVTSPNTAQEFATRHEIPEHYSEYREMLASSEIDAVLIATPNDLHHEIALAAAKAGKHVLCEKPLAMSLDQADEMVAACDAAGVALMYAENLVFVPMYQRVKALAD